MPSLLTLLDRYYPKLLEWEASKERDVYRLGAGAALAQLPTLQKLPKPPDFIEIAKRKKLIGHLKNMLKLVYQGKLTRDSPELRTPYVAPIPFYFRSEAEAELRQQQPNYFDLRDAWALIVQQIIASFTITWDDPYGSFEDELIDYISRRRLGIMEKPNDFSAEIARLNQKSTGDEILAKLNKDFPAISASFHFADGQPVDPRPTAHGNTIIADGPSLMDLLCKLYLYHVRLRTAFEECKRIEGEASDESEASQPTDIVEAVRARLRATGRPFEKSDAWKFTVRWVADRLDVSFRQGCSKEAMNAARRSGVSVEEYYLELYSRYELVPRVGATDQYDALSAADNPIRNRALRVAKTDDWQVRYDVPGEHHKLWEQRQADEAFRRLRKTITRLTARGESLLTGMV